MKSNDDKKFFSKLLIEWIVIGFESQFNKIKYSNFFLLLHPLNKKLYMQNF